MDDLKHAKGIVELYQRMVPDTSQTLQAVANRAMQEFETVELKLAAYRDLLTSIRETRHLGSFAIPAHVKAALELCEEQLAATQAKEG
jgi:hypothetical protein